MEFDKKETNIPVSIETSDEFKIVIYSDKVDDDILKLKKEIENIIVHKGFSLTLKLGNDSFIIPCDNLLFFESQDGYVVAHTINNIYTTDLKLYELEQVLPKHFMRVSKSYLLNLNKVVWYKRELSGMGRAGFSKSDKQVYISRMYYKPFLEKIQEMRGFSK